MVNNSLKEYYIQLTKLYNNALSMIEAMNQSLTSSSSQINVNVTVGDEEKTLTIPSVFYLEGKVEELQNNINNLLNIPENGEAWFTTTDSMSKLQLVRTSTAPVTPELATSSVFASITDNNFLKDLVSPKTFLRMNINNLTDNIEKVYMKKIVFPNYNVFSQIKNLNINTYSEYSAALYNMKRGIDYEEYDSEIKLPIKSEAYISSFKIDQIVSSDDDGNYTLKIKDTLQYHSQDDDTLEYTLKVGDSLSLSDKLIIYKVTDVDIKEMTITVKETLGHMELQTFDENNAMELKYYVSNFNKYHYVDIPLEENQYICIFLSLVYNNTRSIYSDAYLVDLSSIKMYDAFGNPIKDSTGNHMNYMEYYDKYCTNIGDIILGLTETIYPQISNFTNETIVAIQDNATLKSMVNDTFMKDGILQVLPINKHLIDDSTSEDIINLHTQKAEVTSQITTLQENINNTYSTLINTDFSQEVQITQESLRSKLDKYYSEKILLQKQLNSIIENINAISNDLTIARENTKYRVRGITEVETLEKYLHSNYGDKIEIIGLECEYKYKSPTKDTTSVTNINSNIFTDWIKLNNIDRQRQLVFNSTLSGFTVEFVDYSSTTNIIKWNQIDIPIVQGEDVVLRCRYKYNIGQPFIDLYTPWSEEMSVVFPNEYNDNIQLSEILAQNDNDVITAKFSQTLINDGYQEHVNNSITTGDAVFYHMPENIYSGFNTPENNLISLKDKLSAMNTDIESTKSIIDAEFNRKFDVYLTYDETNTKLFSNSINKINIYNSDHITDAFVKKNMNIVIKNTGTSNIKLYSIFPGNIDIPCLLSNNEFYEQYIRHYERVPIFIDNKLTYQTLGQWIYFRQDNPYTGRSIYYNNESQNLQDFKSLYTTANKVVFNSINTYMKRDFDSPLIGYRKRETGEIKKMIQPTWIGLDYQGGGTFNQLQLSLKNDDENDLSIYSTKDIDYFLYENGLSNNYLNRFEDISGLNKDGNEIWLDSETSISEFIADNHVNGVNPAINTFVGAFLYPDITGRKTLLTDGGYNSYIEVEVGKSISIPITFEFYIDGETIKNITKGLYFDIRNSLTNEPLHYMLELTANYDYTATGSMLNSTTLLVDDATL
jgi:hypothetical protein